MSLNRWVFKWRLKVRMFSHSRMSVGRDCLDLDCAAAELSRPTSLTFFVCIDTVVSIA